MYSTLSIATPAFTTAEPALPAHSKLIATVPPEVFASNVSLTRPLPPVAARLVQLWIVNPLYSVVLSVH